MNLQGEKMDYIMRKCTLSLNRIVTASLDIGNKNHNHHQKRKETRKKWNLLRRWFLNL